MFAVIFICISIILVSWDDWEIKKQRLRKFQGQRRCIAGDAQKANATCSRFSLRFRCHRDSLLAPVTLRSITWLIFSRHFDAHHPRCLRFQCGKEAASTLHNDVSIQAYFLLLFICQWVFSIWKEWLRVNTFAHKREIWKTGEMTRKVQCRLNNK